MHLGERIRTVIKQKHMSVVQVSRELSCERTNLYNVFERKDVNTELLQRLCVVLDYDFFKELSQETFGRKRKKGDE